ncbi:pilus assembly protein TadG-related protein [Kribbella aluminosa]|uniref:pilus assembly protein TadG-related protein n=1 Tax=Kribbella aluminosa TaxID=416017 RepID=UPI00355645B3
MTPPSAPTSGTPGSCAPSSCAPSSCAPSSCAPGSRIFRARTARAGTVRAGTARGDPTSGRVRRSERGSATLQVVFAAVLLFAVFAVAILWSAISTARHKLSAAADLTALSAAQAPEHRTR